MVGPVLITVYDTGHPTSARICRAFADGAKAKIIEKAHKPRNDGKAVFVYGVMRGNNQLLHSCRKNKRTWYLCDNGYLRSGHFKGYYRITKNAFLCSGEGEGDFERLDRLNVELWPWRKTGSCVLVCVPPPLYCWAWKFDAWKWTERVTQEIRAATDRPIRFSYKPGLDDRAKGLPPLEDQLSDAWAVVTHDSNVAIDALIYGVPVFVTGKTPARRCGLSDLSRIESPLYSEERREMLAVLAANQWTLAEFRDGTAWRALQR